jgi:CDP-diacylglycerol--glycerol-3-phosphate 3-phosphatidyltransferase
VFSAALVAHALRVPRALRVALWAFLALTLLSTVYFGWHFVVDDVAGLALGAASVWLAAALTGHRAALPALNLPNAISVARLLVVPVVAAVVLLEPAGSLVAAAVFGVAALSDVLDGAVARARGTVTTVGKVLDPLADKVLVVGVLACLSAQGRLPVWVVAVVLVRELAVTALRAIVGRRGVVISASALGKAKTTAQIVLVLAVIVAPDPDAAWVQAVVLAAVALTVASALDYALHLRARQDAPAVSAAS